MTWPPPRPVMPVIEDRPWDPGHPRHPDLPLEADRLLYVVIDEVLEGWVGLSLAAWPHADDAGRLRFPDREGPVDVGTSVGSLKRFLATEETGRKPRGSSNGNGSAPVEVRVGMTFAARPKRGRAATLLGRLRDDAAHDQVRVADIAAVLTRPIDLTEQGRLLAKLAAYGAFFSTLPKHVGERWRLTDEIQS